MVRKHSPTNRDAEPPRIDDLKLINGIGPMVEKRLNGVGIYTFARLAALSPADIAAAVAGLTGLSSERIIKQDWIGQARKLAGESVASEAQKDVEAPVEPQDPIEYAHAATHPVEPQEAEMLTTESVASEAQKDVEAPAVTEQVVPLTAPTEPQASMKHAHAAPLSVVPERDTVPSMKRYHPASFTVEFLLDENNNVHSTHVLHVQSKREHTWTDWQKTQLVDFLSESAGLNTPSDEPVLLNAEESVKAEEPNHAPVVIPESKPLTPLVAMPGLIGTLRLREMEVIAVESGSPRKTLASDEPFDVRITLDLTELQVSGDTLLNYKASIYGKDRISSSGLVIGETQGAIIPTDTVTIKVEGNTLPEGVYHLAATVIFGLPGMKPTVRPGTTAMIDGGQVQVI